MNLIQTTLFGARETKTRLKKSSPLAKIAVGEKVDFHLRIGGEVTSTGHTVLEVFPRPNNFGCDVARITGVSGVVATAALSRTPADGRKGAGLIDLALWTSAAMLLITLALGGVRRGVGVRVEWVKQYPDPVCERCGQVLDGCHGKCFEEGCE